MQNENRESFVFYRSFLGAIREMEAADQLAMFRAVCEYALEGKEPPLTSPIQRAVFAVIRPSVDTNIARREGGKRGGRPTAKTGKAAVSKPETMGFEDKPFPEQGFSPENHGAQRFSKPENTETESESEAEAETEAESETETAAEFKDAGSRRESSRREISRTGALIGPDAVAGQEGNSRSGQESSLTGSAPEETSPGGVTGSIPEGIIRDCGQEISSRQEGGSRAGQKIRRTDTALAGLIQEYQQEIGSFPRSALEGLQAYRAELGDGMVRLAIREAAQHNGRSWSYLDSVLSTWRKEGVKTPGDVEARREKLRSRQQPPPLPPEPRYEVLT